jgi:diguanylate cyclase (GGDEF)-like protein
LGAWPDMDQRVISADPEALVAEISRLRAEVARLESRVEELDRLANMDALAPIANRRGLITQLDLLIARHERHGTPAAMLFVDLDGLKAINDAFGHCAGDAALIHLSELMLSSVRQTDLVARIGGDEFAILLDHAGEASACETAARLADAVAGCEFCHDGQCLPLSVAIGMTPIMTGDSPETVLARADQDMYRVKVAA